MRRTRFIAALVSTTVLLLAVAPAALAKAYGGEGWYGETSDKTITYAMYIVIIFFPLVIVVLSVLQWRLEKRKHSRLVAARRRAANVDWEGGW
jgi:membrane protease YdiL (CAAX protease family)